MVQDIVSQLKGKMNQSSLTAHSLEKRAGLKSNAVHNILSGRSKNPSIHILLSIAKALNCTVSDLVGEERQASNNQFDEFKTAPLNLASETITAEIEAIQNEELYVKCLAFMSSLLEKKKLWFKKKQVISYVDEVYYYSHKKGLNKVDTHFAKWLLEKVGTT